jgi:hypothetical protein
LLQIKLPLGQKLKQIRTKLGSSVAGFRLASVVAPKFGGKTFGTSF